MLRYVRHMRPTVASTWSIEVATTTLPETSVPRSPTLGTATTRQRSSPQVLPTVNGRPPCAVTAAESSGASAGPRASSVRFVPPRESMLLSTVPSAET